MNSGAFEALRRVAGCDFLPAPDLASGVHIDFAQDHSEAVASGTFKITASIRAFRKPSDQFPGFSEKSMQIVLAYLVSRNVGLSFDVPKVENYLGEHVSENETSVPLN